MKRNETEKYRQRLLEMAARLRSDESLIVDEALRQTGGGSNGNLSNVPMHLADMGTETFDQEMNTSLLTNERQMQSDVAAALDRIDKGTFGTCQQCQKDIGEGRLQAVPYTRYCLDCAENAEEDGEAGFQPTLL